MSSEQHGWRVELVAERLCTTLQLVREGDYFFAGRASRRADELAATIADTATRERAEKLCEAVVFACYFAQQEKLDSLRVSQRLHSEAVRHD